MSRTPKIVTGIKSVSSTVRQLTIDWDATDIPHIHASAATLEGSLQPLRKALENGEIAAHLSSAELRSAAQGLKKEAAALERLVDAAAAFLRSGPTGLSNNNSDAYTFDGEIRSAAALPTESYAG